MTSAEEKPDGVWRDEERLPLSELAAAVATSPADGQTDDPTGNDAGIEDVDRRRADTDRALRTDFTGPTGPN
ncbi:MULTISPECIES: hypothetical protein [Catenuloplanes]|uniref:Uncharacterized protein n=1 Tax=Catenuloplanes niger TaxID=587534 RepID=A0AAE4A063_9ACTN|nr:hypothetical protein [Catenuloplanes niger]MDR7327173.1 hypothetical protein [Catenuloplanes niger]